ncbi:diguanylate cyclase (GGDEF)-like protein [Pseudomonas duriflava]|uniref:diguanylate cyclase n=1 Tax=Pseudomonas duriflava TaxID=459528 RepID=A0A562QNV4_9PSED|nr:PleD family two-component system response regulator [Pseudomonas duriflava]TWI58375.1 diguanylate cyclase (GGDEF)-like protein [Pseudomonas duriflava]
MSEHDDPGLDRIKHHFAQRVITQARQVLEIWQRLHRTEWNAMTLKELTEANDRLLKYAQRFDQTEHAHIAEQIGDSLRQVAANRGRLTSPVISDLSQLMQSLSRTGLRHGDQLDSMALPPLRKPIYIALQDMARSQRLAMQMEYFGVTIQVFEESESFRRAVAERHPAVIVMEVDFDGPAQGLQLAAEIQTHLPTKLPILFFSRDEADTNRRLAAVRAGGHEFYTGTLDASHLLEKIENLTRVAYYDPIRVLVVDDSRAQALHTEMSLNSAGILTRTLLNPTAVMSHLAEFNPDLIILDMYMPECTGTELAKVIRQHERYVSVPIIYLSAEGDLDKQLDAMSEGGDDFLTKPIRPHHLIATVRTRAARARSLKARMVQDSLTGLYNHTHTLQLLEDASYHARRMGQQLTFVMLDIDHFKQVNDRYGHPMGDRVIKSLALFLKQRLRKTDHIGRYGGEEFAVVLPDTDAQAALRLIEEIRKRFAEIHYPTQSDSLACTFSAGIAQLSPDQDINDLARQADEALYSAKRNGRNRVEIHGANLAG